MYWKNRLLIILSIAVMVSIGWKAQTAIFKGINLNGNHSAFQKTPDQAENPCWFLSSQGFASVSSETIKARQDRETYGYSDDISLSEVVGIFNQETHCTESGKTQIPLTEEEIVATIIAGPDYGKQGELWLAQEQALFKIVRSRMLPKGSLLVEQGGPRLEDSPLGKKTAQGQRIYLFLGLDKNPREDKLLPPEQIFLLRKRFPALKEEE